MHTLNHINCSSEGPVRRGRIDGMYLCLLVSKLLCILCGHLQEIMRFLGYPLLASKKQKQFEYHVDLLKDNLKDLEGVQGDMNPSEKNTQRTTIVSWNFRLPVKLAKLWILSLSWFEVGAFLSIKFGCTWSLFGLMVPHNSRGSFSWRQVGWGWLAKATDWKSDWIIHPWNERMCINSYRFPGVSCISLWTPTWPPNKITHWMSISFSKSNHPKTTITINPPPGVSPPKQKKGCGKVSKFPVRSWAMVVMSTAHLVQYPWQMRMPVRWQPRPCPRREVSPKKTGGDFGGFVCWWMEELSPNLGKSCNSQVDGFESAVKDWRMRERTRKI